MARLLSNALKREFAQMSSPHPITWLFEVSIPGTPTPFRLANYPESIVFHGLEYLPFGVDVDSIEDASSQALVHLRAAFQNIDQQLSSLLENFWSPESLWTCSIWQVDVTQPNETPLGDVIFYSIGQFVIQWRDAVADLYGEGLSLSTTLPKRRYTKLAGFITLPRRIGF